MSTTIQLDSAHLAIVRSILARHVSGKEVWAFGSRVGGTPKPFSDLDLVIVGDAPLPPNVLSLLREDFARSDLPIKVDVLDWALLQPNFQAIIRQNSVPIQSSPKHAS